MRPFKIPLQTLKRIIDRSVQKRYGISGDTFIQHVNDGSVQYPESDDLVELVKNHIL